MRQAIPGEETSVVLHSLRAVCRHPVENLGRKPHHRQTVSEDDCFAFWPKCQHENLHFVRTLELVTPLTGGVVQSSSSYEICPSHMACRSTMALHA